MLSGLILSSLMLLPAAALAQGEACEHAQPRNLQLDLRGVNTVVFEIGANRLDVRATPNASGKLEGRACASDADRLERMQVTQTRSGSTLVVRALRDRDFDRGSTLNLEWFGRTVNKYAYLDLEASVPDTVTVQLKVGSGDATVAGSRILSVDVGSGDIKASAIRGLVAASVGSGDVELEDIGALEVISVGSGDLVARRVRGAVKVGSIGSGDFTLDGAKGSVAIGSIGSGDANVRDIGGDVTVESLGSGDIQARGIRGALNVARKGSGSVNHAQIAGRVTLPNDNN
ncbi:MAG TPA: hypothetical protein VK325_12785 [Pseudoxanthomonas sp.]|nr:hypothetical protein [Pseudoxanthomonas sp.]